MIKPFLLTIILAVIAMLANFMKPSTMVYLIAIAIMAGLGYCYFIFGKKIKNKARLCGDIGLGAVVFLVVFSSAISAFDHFKYDNDMLKLDKEKRYPPIHFVAMGLKGIGGFDYKHRNGTEKQPNYKAKVDFNKREISKTLRRYGAAGLMNHLLVKYGATLGSGSFGWQNNSRMMVETNYKNGEWTPNQERVRDKTIPRQLRFISKTKLASQLKHYIYEEKVFFPSGQMQKGRLAIGRQFVFSLFQPLYIIMIIGIIIACLTKRTSDKVARTARIHNFLNLALLGALMFLMIFEAGKGRYLVQYIPILIPLSAIGLSRMKSVLG